MALNTGCCKFYKLQDNFSIVKKHEFGGKNTSPGIQMGHMQTEINLVSPILRLKENF